LFLSLILAGCSGKIMKGNQQIGTYKSVVDESGREVIVISGTGQVGTFTPSSRGTNVQRPTNQQTPGTNTPSPSNTTPPADSTELVKMFKEKYGLLVGGSGATPANLQKFADTVKEAWVGDKLKGLSSVTFIEYGDARPQVLGVWGGLENEANYRGKLAHQGFTRNPEIAYHCYNYIKRLEQRYNPSAQYSVDQHTMIHELSHHQCEALSRNFGNELSRDLQQSPNGMASDYAAFRGPGSADYKAEGLTLMLLGRQQSRRYHQDFSPNGAAKSLVQQEFGRMVWN
jgi:hypothetical protein